MQLAHASGAITFAVCISLHMSEVEPEPDHPMPKLTYTKWLGMLLSSKEYTLCLHLPLIHPIG